MAPTMISSLLIMLFIGLLVGIVVGLMPGIAIWTAIALMLPFVNVLDYWDIIIIWLGARIGSQFFGSVAAFLLGVPGENSTMVFIKDIQNFSDYTKMYLIKATAYGSFIASFTGFILILFLYQYIGDWFIYLSNNHIRAVAYFILISLIIFFTKQRSLAALLFFVGFIISEKTDESISSTLYHINETFAEFTPFSLVLGLLVIPYLFVKDAKPTVSTVDFFVQDLKVKSRHYLSMAKGTAIGLMCGMVPGQSATVSAITSYNTVNGSKEDKIIAAEAADNSAIVIGMIPTIIFGIPISIDTVFLINILSIKLVEAPSDFFESIWWNLNIFDLVIAAGLAYTAIYFLLSQKFLGFYKHLFGLVTQYQTIIYGTIIAWIIWIDHQIHALSYFYFLFLFLSSALGIFLHKKNINPVPLLLGFLLGDQIFWAYKYLYHVYF